MTEMPTPSVFLLRCRALAFSSQHYQMGCLLFLQDSLCRAQRLLNRLHLAPLRIPVLVSQRTHQLLHILVETSPQPLLK